MVLRPAQGIGVQCPRLQSGIGVTVKAESRGFDGVGCRSCLEGGEAVPVQSCQGFGDVHQRAQILDRQRAGNAGEFGGLGSEGGVCRRQSRGQGANGFVKTLGGGDHGQHRQGSFRGEVGALTPRARPEGRLRRSVRPFDRPCPGCAAVLKAWRGGVPRSVSAWNG